MQIGQLARRAGVSIDAIRFYERERVLPRPARLPSGYRRYNDEDVTRLRFIRRAKALGFTLGEIRELLALSKPRSGDMSRLKLKTEAKLALVENKLAELDLIRDALQALVDICPGQGRLERCPILHALSEEGDP